MVSARLAGILVILAFVVLLSIALTQPPALKSKEEAVRFVLEDLNSDPALAPGSERFFTPFSANYSNSTGQWTVVVKITLNPHSECPTVLIRSYQLLPIRHGLDKAVTQGCTTGEPIVFEEEAIIASRPALQSDFTARAYACGYKLPIDEAQALAYCADADADALKAFAASAPGAAWLAEWRVGGETKLVALDGQKRILKTS